jgi:hypothetical protein
MVKVLSWKRMQLSLVVGCGLIACIARADTYYDFETPSTSPVWLGASQIIQNTSASYQGTNAIAFTGNYPDASIMTQIPEGTTNFEFFFYDEYGPNPPLYQYMFFRLRAETNSTPLVGFSMLDGGWGTTPPMTRDHYYAWGNDACGGGPTLQCGAINMGPIRTVGWHKFTFRIAGESIAMSVDDALVFQTNLVEVARYLEFQPSALPWGRLDQLSFSTALQPITLVADPRNGGVVTGGGFFSAGSQVEISATPNNGWTFTRWNDGSTQNPRTITVSQDGAAYAARFTFVPMAAAYSGLFYNKNGVAPQSAGAFTLTMTAKSTFTAKVMLAGRTYPFSGRFSPTGSASNSIPLKPGSLTTLLSFDSGGVDILSGQLTDGNWTADLVANRASYSKTNLAPQAGKYTVVIPAGDQAAAQPGGDSYGSVTVSTFGKVSFIGKFADGTKVSQSAVLSKDGEWPLYASLYSGNGSALGWLTISPAGGLGESLPDIDGLVNWIKLPQSTANLYPNGFTNQTEGVGSTYTFTRGISLLNFTEGLVCLSKGNLAAFTNQIILDANSKVTNESTNKLSLKISTSSGMFQGSVVDPLTHKVIPISGAVLQKQGIGTGYFLGSNQSGRVSLGPLE